MKTNLIKYYLAVIYLFSTSIVFAQPSTGTTDGDSVDTTDAPVTSIDAYVWVLMGIGLIFVFYKFKMIRNQNKM